MQVAKKETNERILMRNFVGKIYYGKQYIDKVRSIL